MTDKQPPDHVVKFLAEERERRKKENPPPPPRRKKRPKIEATELMIWLALRNEMELYEGKLFRLDSFSGQTLLMHPIPVPGVLAPQDWSPRDTTDVDVGHLMVWLQANNFVKSSVPRVSRAIDMEAERNRFSSAKAMLESLMPWDGERRLDHFWVDVCGVVPSDPGMSEADIDRRWQYLSATARCFFISIVARIMRPGCKVDTMPVLEGPQGDQKSTLLRIIAFDREEWLSDSMTPDLASKDAKQHLAGKLIIELGEVAQLKRTSVEEMKRFISAQDDKFRPSYGRREIVQKRQCVFVGTTNSKDYLRDITGNRRFWPIECGKINIELAREIMPQLYAEARVAYLAEEQWWLPPEIELIAEMEQDHRLTDDPWEDAVVTVVDRARDHASRFGETFFYVTSTEGLEAIEADKSKWDYQKQYRVASILRKLGGKSNKLPRAGKTQKRGFRFIT